MPPNPHAPPSRDALLSLLDDPAPAVREALLAHFAANAPSSAELLKAAAAGPNRLLAAHARWYLDALRFSDPVTEFVAFIRSLNYELETGALLLARTVYADVDIAGCCAHLDRLAARCRELIAEPASPRERCRVINRVLFHDEGFRGNHEHYTDPENSFLHRVLSRRTGIPISLSVVYLLVAQRLGFALEPIGAPGHFLLGSFVDDPPFFIDPFEGGVLRSTHEVCARLQSDSGPVRPEDLAPTPVREVLCRMCRNLVHHFGAAGEPTRAYLFARFVEEFEATHARHSAES